MNYEDNITSNPQENEAASRPQDAPDAHEKHHGSSADKKKKDKKSNQNEAEIQQLKAKVDELNDKYLRLYSEFDNYRKRTLREKAEMSKTASEEIILSLLPVIDDMERAIKASLKTPENEVRTVPFEGFELIYLKFRNLLVQKGLETIPAQGEPFDVDLHDAITNVPVQDENLKGKVIDEVEKGYKLGGKVIRYAKVVVGS
jgi:molecular chaperone GrpE